MSCNCNKEDCSNNNSRREFLLTGLMATMAVVGCSDKKTPFTPEENVALTGEKVKLLSVDGEIIEVDKAFLKPVPDIRHTSNRKKRYSWEKICHGDRPFPLQKFKKMPECL